MPIQRVPASLPRARFSSVSTFHAQFKAATHMSPLRFRTQIRLQEARRLMLIEGLGAAEAGLRVGYGSTLQFSREYGRLFTRRYRHDIARRRTESRGLVESAESSPCKAGFRLRTNSRSFPPRIDSFDHPCKSRPALNTEILTLPR